MKRRLFLQSGSAAAVSAALAACGGGGGGGGSSSGGTGQPVGVQASGLAVDAMPERILGCYYTAWDAGTYRLTDVPTEFNVLYLFHCKPNGSGTVKFDHFDVVDASMVQTCRGRGQKVILTVGGANHGFAWDDRKKSTRMVESFCEIANRLGGVDGIDFNNFEGDIVHEGNVELIAAEMVWIVQQLRAAYGEGFAVTSPPQPNDPVQQRLLGLLHAAGALTYAAPQYYDWWGFNEPGYIRNRNNTWVSQLGAQSVVVGLSASYANGPSLDDCLREWAAIKAEHPNIRGAYCWSAQHNLDGGNRWGGTMKGQM